MNAFTVNCSGSCIHLNSNLARHRRSICEFFANFFEFPDFLEARLMVRTKNRSKVMPDEVFGHRPAEKVEFWFGHATANSSKFRSGLTTYKGGSLSQPRR